MTYDKGDGWLPDAFTTVPSLKPEAEVLPLRVIRRAGAECPECHAELYAWCSADCTALDMGDYR